MSGTEYILGVDVGTTATKVSLFDLQGTTVASATEEYQLTTSKPLEVEVDIETLWNSFRKCTKQVLSLDKVDPKLVKAVGISAQGETLVVLDSRGKSLRKAIVWLDNRAQEEADILDERFNDGKSYKITGQIKIVPTWPAAKIYWMKKKEGSVFKKVHKYLLVEDYFIWRMTGEFVSEGSLLCSTCYWNIVTKKWWSEMLDFLEISPDQLPDIREPGETVSTITPTAALELGLSKKTVVATGALDQVCGTIGVGNTCPEIFTENIGGALAICATLDKPIFDKQRRVPIHYHGIPDTYMAHTFTTGGMALRWFRDSFCRDEISVAELTRMNPYQFIDREVESVPAGSDGLVTLPHLQGAMAPEANPKAKGVFYGFTLSHKKPHFARSLMESIACIIRRNIEVFEDIGIKVKEIRALGGGARSKVWNQIIADVTNKPVIITMHQEDAACLGAALLAGKATGFFPKLEDAVKSMVKVEQKFEPKSINKRLYDELYNNYITLYESLVSLFERS
jgi:xylulokinase